MNSPRERRVFFYGFVAGGLACGITVGVAVFVMTRMGWL